MAHELTQREDGKIEFAFAGESAWHGLGQELTEGASIEQWVTESGLDWEINESPIYYEVDDLDQGLISKLYSARKALYRSDSLKPLSIVSDKYQIVQPKEVLEFFRDLTESHGFKLSAAGSLFGGTRFWATARTGIQNTISDSNDEIQGYLLLVSSADGTLSTIATQTSVRTVCNNTMRIALNKTNKNLVKVSHLREFDANRVKIDMGVLSASWENYMAKLKTLSSKTIVDSAAFDLIRDFEAEYTPNASAAVLSKRVSSIYNLYKNGAGAGYCEGNKMGILNAYTNYYTHGAKGKSQRVSSGFWSSYMGSWANRKTDVMDLLCA